MEERELTAEKNKPHTFTSVPIAASSVLSSPSSSAKTSSDRPPACIDKRRVYSVLCVCVYCSEVECIVGGGPFVVERRVECL
jgi:hypothetical protein